MEAGLGRSDDATDHVGADNSSSSSDNNNGSNDANNANGSNNNSSSSSTTTNDNAVEPQTDDAIAAILRSETSIPKLRNFLKKLEKGEYHSIVQKRLTQLKNMSLSSTDDDFSPADEKFEKEAANARKTLLPVPNCVRRILAGDYTYISHDHKRLIQDCVPWTIQALKHAHYDNDIKRQVRLLLGTFQYTQCLSWAQPSWPRLMNGLREEMLVIGSELQEIYKSDNLYMILGTLQPPLLTSTNFRQDCEGGTIFNLVSSQSVKFSIPKTSVGCVSFVFSSGLITPSAFSDSATMLHYDYHTIDLEISYIHYVRLIAVAVNEMFKAEIMDLISEGLVGGQVVSGGIKGYERMQNKLKSFADHWNSDIPRFVVKSM